MFGSIFYNFWGSLIAFTIAFIIMYQVSIFPSKILLVSFIVALVTFVVMFAIRYLIGFVLYTPDDKLFESFINEKDSSNDETKDEQEQMDNENEQQSNSSTVEFEDESPEEIAKVVRTMMSDNEKDT
ncbi:MAG: hypothetical protein GX072_14645 [Lysinibacillus sp.]|nr:hypothetical protein [Lysinibacillus sp.]